MILNKSQRGNREVQKRERKGRDRRKSEGGKQEREAQTEREGENRT